MTIVMVILSSGLTQLTSRRPLLLGACMPSADKKYSKRDGPNYDRDDVERIRRSLWLVRKRTGDSVQKLTRRINAMQGEPDNETYPLNWKTLQRFDQGKSIWNIFLKFIDGYLDEIAPEEPIENLGDSLALFLGEKTVNMLGHEHSFDALQRKFVKAYDVYVEGQLFQPESEEEKRLTQAGKPIPNELAFRPVHPDADPFDRPFEIPYSRIYLRAIPASRWLRVTEIVTNEAMRNVDDDRLHSGEVFYDGILTFADFDNRFIIIGRGPVLNPPKVFVLEKQHHIDAEEPKPYVGAMISVGRQRYTTDIEAKQIRLMPVKGSPIIADDDD